MIDLGRVSAVDVLALLRTGELSSAELLEASLDRVAALNGELNAVVALDVDRARGAARAADDAHARGEWLGPLHGLPMTVKDVFETAGLVTTSGAPELAGHVPARDADAVARLRAAGAVIYGKTNVPRYGGDFQTDNAVYGRTSNPWLRDRTPGGSSGGSAVAVATGMSLLEIGSDIAGSIRAPAHYCGVLGHAPTWSAVPRRGHVPGPPGSLAEPPLGVVGPLARGVDDLELALSVLVGGALAGVPGGKLPEAVAATRELASCRVAAWLDNPLVPGDPGMLAVLRALVDRIAGEGALVVDKIRPPRPFYEMQEIHLRTLFAAFSAGFSEEEFAGLLGRASGASAGPADPAALLAQAVTLSYREWVGLEERRARIEDRWRNVFAQVDVVLTPVTPLPAFPHDTDRPPAERELVVDGRPVPYFAHTVWTCLASVARLPSTVVPAGRTPAGLPVGIQIITPRWQDRSALAFARLVEGLNGGFEPPPCALTPPARQAASGRGGRTPP